MSSSQDNSQKNSKVPIRPEGVQKADEEHTGFLKYNKNEKDPLIELFDTLQTVKDKNEQNKEPLTTHTFQNTQNSIFSIHHYFSKKWMILFFIALSSGATTWLYYQDFFTFEFQLKRELASSPEQKSDSIPNEKTNTTQQINQKTNSPPQKQNNNMNPSPKHSAKGAPLKTPDRKNLLGAPLPEKDSNKSGGFFPTEDPGYDEPAREQNEEDPNTPNEDPSMDDLNEDGSYEQEDDVSTNDSEDAITTADDGNLEDAGNPKSKKKRNRKKASQPY